MSFVYQIHSERKDQPKVTRDTCSRYHTIELNLKPCDWEQTSYHSAMSVLITTLPLRFLLKTISHFLKTQKATYSNTVSEGWGVQNRIQSFLQTKSLFFFGYLFCILFIVKFWGKPNFELLFTHHFLFSFLNLRKVSGCAKFDFAPHKHSKGCAWTRCTFVPGPRYSNANYTLMCRYSHCQRIARPFRDLLATNNPWEITLVFRLENVTFTFLCGHQMFIRTRSVKRVVSIQLLVSEALSVLSKHNNL